MDRQMCLKIGLFSANFRSPKTTGPAQRPPEGPRRDGATFEPDTREVSGEEGWGESTANY